MMYTTQCSFILLESKLPSVKLVIPSIAIVMCPFSAPKRLTDRKREAIVLAATEEFRTAGFEATSMDKVAASAGVSKRTVYNHFPSKDELFAEILLQLWHRSLAQVDLAYRRERPLRVQLLELIQQKMHMLSDTHFLDLARVAIAETIHSPERAQSMVSRLSEKEEGITTWLRAAVADGRIKAVDPEFAAQQLQGMVKAFAFWPQVTMSSPPMDLDAQQHLAESSVDMFLAYYAA
jgi:TetR/AcrR family transcriptional regulator, regulator of autoinduction and epiphytic fitness